MDLQPRFVGITHQRPRFAVCVEQKLQVGPDNGGVARDLREAGRIAGLPVACLTRRHCFAEKFLANADRGLDASTLSRDIVDLAFMIEGWSKADADTGLAIARSAYGDAVHRSLAAVTAKMREDRTYRNRCIEGLAIAQPKVMTAGIRALSALA